MEMSKNSLATYYQDNKEILGKKVRERYQNLSKEEKNPTNVTVKDMRISQNMKNKSWLNIAKSII